MKLYELTAAYNRLQDDIESGNIPEDAIADTLEAVQGEFDEKVDNIACLIKNLKTEAEGIKAEEQALAERRRIKENRIKSLTEYLSEALISAGKRNLETARNALSFRRSYTLEIDDENAFKIMHRDLCTVITTVNIPKKEITDRIKSGFEVSGAELVEHQNLQVR